MKRRTIVSKLTLVFALQTVLLGVATSPAEAVSYRIAALTCRVTNVSDWVSSRREKLATLPVKFQGALN